MQATPKLQNMKISTRADDADKHSIDVTHLLFHKGKLYSGGDDGKVKVWQNDLKLLGQVQAHATSVYSLAASDDTLYSCSNDGTIKAWDLNTLKEKGTLLNDNSLEVWKLYYSDGHLFAGDNNGDIRVYKNDKFYGEFNIAEPVKDMAVWKSFVYTVKDLDLVITQAKLEGEHLQYGTITTLTGKSPVTLIGEKYLIFASRSGKDIILHENIHDNHYKAIGEVKDASELIINAMGSACWDGQCLLFSGGWDKKVKKWKLDGAKATQEGLGDCEFVVNAIAVGDKGLLYAAGGDGHIVRLDA